MAVDRSVKAKLYQATDTLGEELFLIEAHLDTYCLLGLNASRIPAGKVFFGHLQQLSLLSVALGLAKVFEREESNKRKKKPRYKLCSVSGVWRLAKSTRIDEIAAAHAFAERYGVKRRDNWVTEIEQVFATQRPIFRRHLQRVTKARNTRIAHLQQAAPLRNLPSIAAFEELLAFAVNFHAFVNRAFLATHAHPILSERRVAQSLRTVLTMVGVKDVVTTFPVTPQPVARSAHRATPATESES